MAPSWRKDEDAITQGRGVGARLRGSQQLMSHLALTLGPGRTIIGPNVAVPEDETGMLGCGQMHCGLNPQAHWF